MEKNKYENRIIFYHNNDDVILDITPSLDKDESMKISSSSSIVEFPSLQFEVNLKDKYNALYSISDNDMVKFLIKKNDSDMFDTLFNGTFLSKNIKMEKDKVFSNIKMQFIHSFYKISLLQIRTKNMENITLLNFLNEVMTAANINCKIIAKDEILSLCFHGKVHNTNAFRVFKEFCIMNELIVIFESNNSISIDFRKSMREKMHTSIPITIKQDDIVSMRMNENI